MDMSPSQSTQPLAVLERAYDFVLKAFGDTLKLRHRETGEHSKRVAGFSIAIAAQLQLSPKQISIVGRGAFLHDVGKIGVPDSVLLKPGKLSNDELVTMQTYCANGYEIVKTVPFLAEAAEIVYCHQERPDGKGYPRGLKGNDIPLGAKIVAIANALDAITSDWPYRAAKSFEFATEEIRAWSGSQFDPEIVQVFVSIPMQKWVDLCQQIGNK